MFTSKQHMQSIAATARIEIIIVLKLADFNTYNFNHCCRAVFTITLVDTIAALMQIV